MSHTVLIRNVVLALCLVSLTAPWLQAWEPQLAPGLPDNNQPPPLPLDLPPVSFIPARKEPIGPLAPQEPALISTNRRFLQTPAIRPVPNQIPPLAWDSDFKQLTAKPGEEFVLINFALTNMAREALTIRAVRPSCGCTLAEIPPVPWVLNPGSDGVIKTKVDLKGKRQMVSKSITVDTSHGYKILSFRVVIPEPTLQFAGAAGQDRARNTAIASADRQAVFRGECASCHVEPAVGKTGLALYTAACGICHEGDHRAAFVPDLRQLKVATSPEYWLQSIVNGKPGSLMPAFAKQLGGPLTDPQIQSLVEYLSASMKPVQPAAAGNIPAALLPTK